MPVSGWMSRINKWKDARGERGHASALLRAVAHGDSLDTLLDLGVQSLLEAAAADRAGLWFAADRRGESGRGRVIEAKPGPIPEEWKHVDISTPFLRTALESPHPLRVEVGNGSSIPHLGPLVGMHSAIWLPLRAGNYTLGLAMVAHADATANPTMELLVDRADEIALAIKCHHDAGRAARAAEELRALSGLSRAILCGVSTDSILPQIARAARNHMQAEFVTLGKGSAPPSSEEAWDGPEEWRDLLHQEPVLHVWRRAFEEGRDCELAQSEIPAGINAASETSHATLDHVIAIPIEARNQTIGVLMAGFLASEDSSDDLVRLESYALLAATALDREFAREERAACKDTRFAASSRTAANVSLLSTEREPSAKPAGPRWRFCSLRGRTRRKCCSKIYFLPPREGRSRNGAGEFPPRNLFLREATKAHRFPCGRRFRRERRLACTFAP